MLWPWGSNNATLAQANTYMNSIGYVAVSLPTDKCVVAYGTSQNSIGHFSKVDGGIIKAKLGEFELMQHRWVDAYYSNSSYGSPQAYYVKQ